MCARVCVHACVCVHVRVCVQVELADCVSMLVGNNERIQAIVSQLEETCRAVDVSSPSGVFAPLR